MVDVQVVAGRRPELVSECVRRLADFESISAIYVANNTGANLTLDLDEIIDNEKPLSFEQNHNALARVGKSPFILFLDDDAFLFEGCLQLLLEVMRSNPSCAAVGAQSNQTFATSFAGRPTPVFATFDEFLGMETRLAAISAALREQKSGSSEERIFLPGNCLLVRRKVWQREYGGWDESYQNWNEEIDYLLWCQERGYETRVATGAWFFHCQAQSRNRNSFLENIVESARHHLEVWPAERYAGLEKRLSNKPGLLREVRSIRELNLRNSQVSEVEAGDYYRLISGTLE